tara:strand:- start:3939 stop:4685 length:747 start_codon:yes stop_codon:yes gene_type:complete
MEIVKAEKPALLKIASYVLGKPSTEIEGVVESEMFYLQQRVSLSGPLQECTQESLLMCIRHAIRDNMSLDESAGLVYIYPQGVKTKSGNWVKVAKYELSPNGLLSLARQTGSILDNTQVKLVKDGKKVIGGNIELLLPSTPSPRWETFEFDIDDIERWKKFSAKKNKGTPNALYLSGPEGSIDSGFMKAKVLKHSLKNKGTNVSETRGQILKPLPEEFIAPLTNEENATLNPSKTDGGAEDVSFEPEL